MTTDDYSFCQEESVALSGGSPPPSNNDHGNTANVPSEILDPADREACALLRNKLDTLLDLVSKNNKRSEGTNMAACIVELVQANERLVQANERLSAQVMKSREETLRLRQENDALKASAEFKRTAENLSTQVERLELEATKKYLEQLVVNLNEKRDQEREEMMLAMAELKECLRVQQMTLQKQMSGLEQQEHETFDTNKRAFEQLIVTFNEKNDEFKSSILNHAAKNHVELKSSMAAIHEKLRLDQNNADVDDTTNQDTNEAQTTYSVPSQPTNFPWKRSKGSIACTSTPFRCECDILDCPPLLFGNKYKWSIKVISKGGINGVGLGVASTIHEMNFNEYFGSQEGGWSYDSDGYADHANNKIKSNLPKYKDGSKLTFLLDLTGNGTLNVYLDDDATNLVKLFNTMKSDMNMDRNPLAGFIPAASSYQVSANSAKIEFLGFEDF